MRGRHYIDLYGLKITEEQKTPWFGVDTPPSRPGFYELRDKTGAILDGRYLSGKWSVAYAGGPYELLRVPPFGLEWRGLLTDPQTRLKNAISESNSFTKNADGSRQWIL